MAHDHQVTQLLRDWSEGDPDALDELIPLIFDDLHRMAQRMFQRESPNHTLQPTALINELYFRLRGRRNTEWINRARFFKFAAELMRFILVDHARRRRSDKRGGGVAPIPLESLDLATELNVDVIALDLALEELARIDERQSQIVSLRFFVGLKVEEVAEILDIAPVTVKRLWRTAKFWLHRRLDGAKDEATADDAL